MLREHRVMVIAALSGGPMTVAEIARRVSVQDGDIRAYVVRLCEIGVAVGLVVDERIVYRLRQSGLTERDAAKAEARCDAIAHGREAA